MRIPGRTLKRFRGAFLARVAEFEGEPIRIPMAGSEGRSFDGPDANLTIRSIQLDPAKDVGIKVVLRLKHEDLDLPESETLFAPAPAPVLATDWSPFLPCRFLWLDDKGRERGDWFADKFERKGPREAAITFRNSNIELGDGKRPELPATLLFYDIIRTNTEIPFGFRDIPLP